MSHPGLQTSSWTEVKEEPSPSVPHFPSTMTSVLLSGAVLQPTQLFSDGERHSVFLYPSSTPSSSCDSSDPGATPSTCLHDPSSSSTPVLSASALDSQHAALSSQDVASPSVPVLPAPTPPHLPHPSHSQSGRDTDSVYPTISFGYRDNDGVWSSGSSSDLSVFDVTPRLQTVLVPSGTVSADSSWDVSLSKMSFSLSPTLQPSVLFSEFVLSDATRSSSKSGSFGFEDWRYATGSTVEVSLPDVSEDGLPLASDLDIDCGCSLEPSASSSWLHVSLHVLPLSAPWNPTSLEMDSSPGLLSTSGVGIHSLLHSPSAVGSDGPSVHHPLHPPSHVSPCSSFPEFLQVTHRDLHVSVDATLSTVEDLWLLASGRNTAFQTSSLPFSPTASPSPPTPEGQVLDASSSTSGSALFTDSQEGNDHEWDGAETSASGSSAVPQSTSVVSTASVTTVDSGPSSGDLEEQSSAFYFESGSGAIPDVGGSGTPAVSEVTPLGGTEQSSSGQGDNETSSDFSISGHAERESEDVEPVEGKHKQSSCKRQIVLFNNSHSFPSRRNKILI